MIELIIIISIVIFIIIIKINKDKDKESTNVEDKSSAVDKNDKETKDNRLVYGKKIYLEFCNSENICLTHKRESNESHYFQSTTAASPYWIYRWPTTTSHTNKFVKYGDPILISAQNKSFNTSNCGWHGCLVLQAFSRPQDSSASNRGLKFGPSWTSSDGDNPGVTRKFYLLPLRFSEKKIGDNVDLGEDLYLSSSMSQINTNRTCGYYGCRILRIPGVENTQSEQPVMNHFNDAHAFRIQLYT